jgi:hypothetical protein
MEKGRQAAHRVPAQHERDLREEQSGAPDEEVDLAVEKLRRIQAPVTRRAAMSKVVRAKNNARGLQDLREVGSVDREEGAEAVEEDENKLCRTTARNPLASNKSVALHFDREVRAVVVELVLELGGSFRDGRVV